MKAQNGYSSHPKFTMTLGRTVCKQYLKHKVVAVLEHTEEEKTQTLSELILACYEMRTEGR